MAFSWPFIGTFNITSDYGERINPISGALQDHNGIDFSINSGSSILASDGGTVYKTGYNSAMGNYVYITHSGGITTVYKHLSNLLVKAGDIVAAGQEIAKSGNTGQSTGAHLEFQVLQNGVSVDPKTIVTGDVVNGKATGYAWSSSGASDPNAETFQNFATSSVTAASDIVEFFKTNWLYIVGGLAAFGLITRNKK